MRDLTDSLAAIFVAIDDANRRDPNALDAGPRALVEGQRATEWLERLVPDASPALQVAARAHHLRRWELQRSDYPEGRAGYLRWRRDNKAHQADATAAILDQADWPRDKIDRTRELLGRTQLRTDPETQALEDVACLVFLETQFAAMVERTDPDHMVTIVAKTLRKMSDQAIEAAGTLTLEPAGQRVISDAVASLSQEPTDD